MFLRQGTQTTIKVGPLLDSTDYKTRETGFNSASAGLDIDVYKEGGGKTDLVPSASSSAAGYFGHSANGNYYLTLSSAHLDTVGNGGIDITVTGALPFFTGFVVLDGVTYDSLVAGTDYLNVDALYISGSSTAADSLEANIGNLDAAVSDVPTVGELDTQLSSTHTSGSWAAGTATSSGIAAAVLDSLLASHTIAGSVGEGIAGATAPTVEEIDAQLSSTHSSGSWEASGSLGNGAYSFAYTVTDSCSGAALSDCLVEVTSSSSNRHLNRVCAWRTNSFGIVTFQLDGGTFYFWRKKDGYYFNDPDVETVSS